MDKLHDKKKINQMDKENLLDCWDFDYTESDNELFVDSKIKRIQFKGGCQQKVVPELGITNLGCYICQKNFKLHSDFCDHVGYHGSRSNFKFLSEIRENKLLFREKNRLELRYGLSEKTHYFYFTIKTNEKDIIIERIVVIQNRHMPCIKNNEVPYELKRNGLNLFKVDSDVFTKTVTHPIVIIFREKSDKSIRFIEEHHFVRFEKFPKVHMILQSLRLLDTGIHTKPAILEQYNPDGRVVAARKDKFAEESLNQISPSMKNYIQEGMKLDKYNAADILSVLLQIEDLEIKIKGAVFAKNVKIRTFQNEYCVMFPRNNCPPSLASKVGPCDDIVLTSLSTSKKYFSRVEQVYFKEICFKYTKSKLCEYDSYNVFVQPSRLLFRYQYRALKLLKHSFIRSYLFPENSNPTPSQIPNVELKLFNPAIGKNLEQLQAVKCIAKGSCNFAPFIIFGPPGTGKTSTVVEAVLQLWKNKPTSRILVAAGSNGACDAVALRLCKVLLELEPEVRNIVRIYSKSNQKRLDSVDDILLECSNCYQGHFYPTIKSIKMYRIVVCTLAVVGQLVLSTANNFLFSHIFLDECGASTIPEVMVSLMDTCTIDTRLILSGDPKQLGPIIKSPIAANLGLQTSYLEYLMGQKTYAVDKKGNYDRSIQSRLIQNYRAHPDIVAIYNELYYDNKLQAMADKKEMNWAVNWHLLPNKKHPIIFHSVYGKAERMKGSFSLHNKMEINMLMTYVEELMNNGLMGRDISEADIGIISPYKDQYTRIHNELVQRGWNQIEVGAVETFQGKEKPIIIVSVTCSFGSLGFIKNPKRINVFLSRPKCLLIVIGNEITLSKCAEFKSLLQKLNLMGCVKKDSLQNLIDKINKWNIK